MKRFKLRARFSLVLVLLLVATFAAITLVIIRQTTHALRTSLINESKSFATLATQPIGDSYVLFHDSGTIRIVQKIDSFANLDSNIEQVSVVDSTGSVLFRYHSAPHAGVPAGAASSVTPSYLYDSSGRLTTIVAPYVESFGVHRYTVAYTISYASVDQSVREIVAVIVGLSAAILLLSLVVWYIFINRLFLRPVAQISRDTLLISQGDLSRKVHLGRNDEIGDLARAVDTMANSLKADITKLEELDRTKSEFLMITSHNLRSPLTVIRGYLEEMNDLHSVTDVQQFIKPIQSSVLELQAFAERVLIISGLEAGSEQLRRKPVAIAKIITDIGTEFKLLAEQKHQKFTLTCDTEAWASLDPSHFHSALWSVLDNAYKFTPEGGSIDLTVMEAGGRVGVSVTDSGIGISDDEIPKLFTKFHRGTDTLTYNYEGAGIGLYLTKLIMQQHGGEVSAQSTEGHGSTFTLWLPILPR